MHELLAAVPVALVVVAFPVGFFGFGLLMVERRIGWGVGVIGGAVVSFSAGMATWGHL